MNKIAIDLDGVLADTIQSWIYMYNTMHIPHITKKDVDRFEFYLDLGLAYSYAINMFNECWKNFQNIEPCEKNLREKTKTISEKYKIDIVTASSEKNFINIKSWLKLHGVYYDNLVWSEQKHELPYDLYIDDSPVVIDNVFKAHKKIFIYSQRWNNMIKTKVSKNASRIRISSITNIL